jgi:hypothetical protein
MIESISGNCVLMLENLMYMLLVSSLVYMLS